MPCMKLDIKSSFQELTETVLIEASQSMVEDKMNRIWEHLQTYMGRKAGKYKDSETFV